MVRLTSHYRGQEVSREVRSSLEMLVERSGGLKRGKEMIRDKDRIVI